MPYKNKEKQRANYYKNREKRILYQREYDKKNKEKKNKYEREKRRGETYNFKKNIQHYSQKYHYPILIKEYKNCPLCNSKTNLQIHHIKYTKDIKDCMLVCSECHKKIHRKI